jgi:hypothetical protein
VTQDREVPPDPEAVVDGDVNGDGVDRGLIRRHLAMSPEERLRELDEYLAFFDSVRVVKRATIGPDPTDH